MTSATGTDTSTEFPLVWDSSIRSTYVSCQKKFYWEYMRKLSPVSTSIHLHFGGAFAAGAEAFRFEYYDPRNHGRDPQAVYDDALAAGMQAIIEKWGTEPMYVERQNKSLDTCLLGLDEYFTHHPPATDPIQPFISPTTGKPAVEFRFAIPLEGIYHPDTGEEIIYAGRFDLLGVYNKQLFIVDEKTTTQLGASWLKQWDMRGQFIGYVWGAQQHDIKTAGAIIRGMSILSKSFGFAEVILTIPQWKINEWYTQLCVDILHAIQAYKEGYFSKAFADSCSSYGGCPYTRLCDTPKPENWVDAYYVTKYWNPLQDDPTAPPPETTL